MYRLSSSDELYDIGWEDYLARGGVCAVEWSEIVSDALEEKLSKRARGILDRELKPRKGAPAGTVKQRFLGAVTHRGQMCLWGTVECQCQRIYELSDRYGLAHRMLAHLLSGALKAGYDVVACPSPMAPDRLEHLLIPQLSLAFLSSSPAHPYGASVP